jgi:hypothetical protein
LDGLAKVTVWDESYRLGQSTLEALVEASQRFDFAILVLTPDDLQTSRGRRRQAPRDNVLFECGLFVGTLGRFRTFLVFDQRKLMKLPSDLAGITMASFGDAGKPDAPLDLSSALKQITAAIKSLGNLRPRPSPFWQPFLSAESCIVLGRFESFTQFEASGLLGLGDAICLTEVSAGLRMRYGGDLPVRYSDRLSGDDFGHNLILLGGPDANSTTREVLPKMPTSLRFGDASRDESPLALYSSVSGRAYVPQRDGNDELCVDYGVILRTSNPFKNDRMVIAIFGCFGFGTWAAGRHAFSNDFLADPTVAKGAALECVVRTEIIRGVPQQVTVCEIRELAG